MTASVMATNDVMGGLTRRFTTNALPTLTPIGQQRKQAAGDYTVSTCEIPCDMREASFVGGYLQLGFGKALVGEGSGLNP